MRVVAWVCCWLAACAGSPAPFVESPESCERARVPVRLVFEPALPAERRLHYSHECGEHRVVATGSAAIDLMLPEGPVVFGLEIAGTTRELAVLVRAGMAPVVWDWCGLATGGRLGAPVRALSRRFPIRAMAPEPAAR
ncbi:MAG: hypothetical protein JNK15_23830 [Planctomycetes bacterium]|nr:hypothetical protein [Planctomycetota bacterium]